LRSQGQQILPAGFPNDFFIHPKIIVAENIIVSLGDKFYDNFYNIYHNNCYNISDTGYGKSVNLWLFQILFFALEETCTKK
jgi:hypothetical protein